MGKFEIDFSVEKLQFKIKGERDVIPIATHALQQHLVGLLKPVDAAAAAENRGERPVVDVSIEPGNGGARKSVRSSGRKGGDKVEQAVGFKHDTAKYGNPRQEWSIGQKVVWLLHIVQEQAGKASLTAPVIAATFNKQFREAGRLNPRNIKRDLKSIKVKTPCPIGEDTSKSPSEWFLIESGKKQAVQLVASATGASQAIVA